MAIIPFRVDTERGPDGVTIVAVKGELDLGTAPELEAQLDAATTEPDSRVMVDLADCDFIDSTGVAVIVRTWQRHDSAGGNGGTGRLALCCPSAQVKRLLEITGVGSTLLTYDDRDAALADLRD